jgi:hypothetical protein
VKADEKLLKVPCMCGTFFPIHSNPISPLGPARENKFRIRDNAKPIQTSISFFGSTFCGSIRIKYCVLKKHYGKEKAFDGIDFIFGYEILIAI